MNFDIIIPGFLFTVKVLLVWGVPCVIFSEVHTLPTVFNFRNTFARVKHSGACALVSQYFSCISLKLCRWTWQVSLFALSFWSFHFASICAFGLLAYVGYIVYAFPSLFRLHRLNGLLLVFILLWAVATYVFNVAFAFLKWKLGKVAPYLALSFTSSS